MDLTSMPTIDHQRYTSERDACGVGFVVDIKGNASNKILKESHGMLQQMKHRGGCQCDKTGDGAGIMTAIPHKLLMTSFMENDLGLSKDQLPLPGDYATGIAFIDKDPIKADTCIQMFGELAEACNLKVLGWRDVPHIDSKIGQWALELKPLIKQVFVTSTVKNEELSRKVFMLRKMATHCIEKEERRFYICSLSTQTIVYKGLLTPQQLEEFYLDLTNPDFETHFALVHSRFSTNTKPSWERAHPQRMLAHNGEINTVQGNIKNMIAREGNMRSKYFRNDLNKLFPVIEKDQSDSGCVDNILEFLVQAGHRSLPEAMMTLVPEAWQNDKLMSKEKKDFYQWSACAMEPWDGPALFTFADGQYIGAVLDRNGLRPSRYFVTKENIMVMASEVGVASIDQQQISVKGRLMPGKMLLVDTIKGAIINDDQLKHGIATQNPYGIWLNHNLLKLKDFEDEYQQQNGTLPHLINKGLQSSQLGLGSVQTDRRMPLFGYSVEDISMLILPMIKTGKEALGSMGNDTPLACMTMRPQLVCDYFKQLFAQVTNPPIDPFRERIVMSLESPLGPEGNLLLPNETQCQRLYIDTPILSSRDISILLSSHRPNWRCKSIDITYPIDNGNGGLITSLDRICTEAVVAVESGAALLLLTDRNAGPQRVPVSSLLATGCVHQHLIKMKLRRKLSIICESGEAREIHHLCTLLGFGADAIHPYLVFETFYQLCSDGLLDPPIAEEEIISNYKNAADIGIRKVMAKMGISTLHSYKGSQIFEAVGLGKEVMDRCFSGTASRIGGVNFAILAQEALDRHRLAFSERDCDNLLMNSKGVYHWRDGGEQHVNDPRSIAHLQDAARNDNSLAYQKYVTSTMLTIKACTLRGQMDFKFINNPIPLSLVEDAVSIVKRFCTGAMSFGSISEETHKTLAVAMNGIGGKSNSGEGGEDPSRYTMNDVSTSSRSAIKQVASGRFGVTIAYLANADDLQIKMAQGAKPGEGGELPGYKVTEKIANTRHSVPGVSLISPPPHHDIYSIEDLAQLIYDLKCANPKARISVKLVSEVGVGVIASGVVKGFAEHIVISGHDGGTGASSWTGVKHAGLPWELGLSETHQTLVKNGLRGKVVLQTDGQIRTGRDVLVAAILGADEFGFSTAPLIALGCTMMRKCHLNTCPVGIATQDPVLRAKFDGKPEYVVNYLFMIAEEIRLLLSRLGCRSLQDVIGRTELLTQLKDKLNDKTKLLNYSSIIGSRQTNGASTTHNVVGGTVPQEFDLNSRLDYEIIEKAQDVIDGNASHIYIEMNVKNTDRTFGTTLSYEVARRYSDQGLPDNSIHLKLFGSGGQSFGAFLAKGITLELEGDANDYIGKGLSGGKLIIYPSRLHDKQFICEENIIVGNVCFYGATSGKAFIRGIAAERFCVRNSGALAVAEGCGDHGCEYMTGGVTIILGSTGRNFAAGMSGGIAYVLDIHGDFKDMCNEETVALESVLECQDADFLLSTVTDHWHATRSAIAKKIIDDWQHYRTLFVKVFPNDYRRALNELNQSAQPISQDDVSTNSSPEIERKKPRSEIVDIEDVIPNATHDQGIVDRLLDKSTGFVKYARSIKAYRSAKERMSDWHEIYADKSKTDIKVQTARCMDCGVPFCQSHTGCPLGNVIPKWNDLVFHGKWKEALDRLLQTNNFPEFTGRVCPAPCEGACVLSINAQPVTIKSIECTIIDHAFNQGWMQPQIPSKRTNRKVAIIGSGPAGLAAACQLNKAGHTVTVFERNDRCGGLLMYGIPRMKLNKSIVERRISLMRDEGIEFVVNVEIGKDVTTEQLMADNDALLLATGSSSPRNLTIPGRHLRGIHLAMEFLETSQKHQFGNYALPSIDVKGKDVIIIGGGDTGVDCIGTSVRQDAKSITTFELLTEPPKNRSSHNPWPSWPRVFRVEYGHEEVNVKYGQDPRVFNVLCKEFIGNDNGNLTGVSAVCVDWVKDNTGRWIVEEMKGTEQTYHADYVFIALGFIGPEKHVSQSIGLETDVRENFATAKGKYNCSVDRVYAAGDCRYGQSLIVTAIAEGRQAARQIDLDLMGTTSLAGPGGDVEPPRAPPRQHQL